jgi:hypothetical protein
MTTHGSRRTGLLRARVARAGLAALSLLALASAAALAGDPGNALYQWTDEHGNVRYTPDPDRVPSGQRATLQRVEPGMPPAGAPAQPPGTPLVPAPAARATPVTAPNIVVPPVENPTPVLAPIAQPSAVAAPNATTAPVDLPNAVSTPVPPPNAAAAPLAAPSAAPTSDARPAPPPAALPAAAAATREQQLVAAIAADQEALKGMLAATPIPGENALVDSPQLREIARRLPELQAELRTLRERQTPPAGP